VYVNGSRLIAAMNLTMEEILPDKGILEKLTREGKILAFYIAINKAKTLNKP
jgi:hypothetical protein